MKKVLAVFLALLVSCASFAMNDDVPEKDKTMAVPDKSPEFKGGEVELYRWLTEQVVFPKKMAAAGIGGRVVVGFVVKKDGSIADVHVVEGVHPLLDSEAIRVIRYMPKWNPGKMNGAPVNVSYQLPVTFRPPGDIKAVDYTATTAEDVKNMLIEAIEYQISEKFMGNLRVSRGTVMADGPEILLDLTLAKKPDWWDEDDTTGNGPNLLKYMIYPFSSDFRRLCMEQGVAVKCVVKPSRNQSACEFDVSGPSWLPEE